MIASVLCILFTFIYCVELNKSKLSVLRTIICKKRHIFSEQC